MSLQYKKRRRIRSSMSRLYIAGFHQTSVVAKSHLTNKQNRTFCNSAHAIKTHVCHGVGETAETHVQLAHLGVRQDDWPILSDSPQLPNCPPSISQRILVTAPGVSSRGKRRRYLDMMFGCLVERKSNAPHVEAAQGDCSEWTNLCQHWKEQKTIIK